MHKIKLLFSPIWYDETFSLKSPKNLKVSTDGADYRCARALRSITVNSKMAMCWLAWGLLIALKKRCTDVTFFFETANQSENIRDVTGHRWNCLLGNNQSNSIVKLSKLIVCIPLWGLTCPPVDWWSSAPARTETANRHTKKNPKNPRIFWGFKIRKQPLDFSV